MIAASNNTRKTKIVATLGPASSEMETIKNLILTGVNVFRLNFSHGSHESHKEIFDRIHLAANELGQTVAVLQDLSGPKIRISELENSNSALAYEDEITLKLSDGSKSNSSCVFVELVDPTSILSPGQRVLIADGIIELKVISSDNEGVRCQVLRGGDLRSRVGIAFPDSVVTLPATTEKDIADLKWGIENKVDYVAISFVQTAEDVRKIKDIIKETNSSVRIISKIEHKTALKNIDEIIKISDGIMVARGDLGLEVPVENVPALQRELIDQANYYGLPVIVATQMLHSMVTATRPTRAEVTDVATAVRDGADAVMLSEETAIGKHPIESVSYLDRIARATEACLNLDVYRLKLEKAGDQTVADSIAFAACAAAEKVNAAALIAITDTGRTPRLLAKYRSDCSLFGVSSHRHTMRQMCLYWGITPLYCDMKSSSREVEVYQALNTVQESLNPVKGAKAVITSGLSGKTGSTSMIEIKDFGN